MAVTDIDWGTVTLTNGSTAVTGSGTSWIADDIRDGDTFVFVDGGDGFQQPIVASVQSNTELTLRNEWEGPTLTAVPYTLRYQWDSSRVSAMSRRLIMLLGSGNLEAEAGLVGAADTLSYYTGPGAKALTPLTAFARTLLDDANAAGFWDTLGATSPPASAFRRGNILGTVSQSGGVPSGAIIERGSNANGEYVRFADGTQECWGTVTIGPVDINLATPGGGFRSLSQSCSLPASFIPTPDPVHLTSLVFNAPSVTAIPESQGASAFQYRLLSITSYTFTSGVFVFHSKGRWF